MKRSIGEMESNITSMANCLMLLSQRVNGGGDHDSAMIRSTTTTTSAMAAAAAAAAAASRVFECKTCNRQFASFQALGGHRASHKKPKLNESSTELQMTQFMNPRQGKPKTHECSICGLEFSIGQALGGHMRRHRANNNNNAASGATTTATTITTSTTTDNSSSTSSINVMPSLPIIQQVPVLKRSSSRRVLCLDLNLSPPENYDVEVPLGISGVGFVEKNVAPAPMIHCFI